MNTIESPTPLLTHEQLAGYERDGFAVVRGLFRSDEIAEICAIFDRISAEGKTIPGHWFPERTPETANDPLKQHPRVMMPHRFEKRVRDYLLDRRLHDALAALLGEEPIASQSMFYYKPPGAPGQALHQDNFYLHVRPGSCIAAWVAVDAATPDNGGLYVVPGTHKMSILCPGKADEKESFTTHFVRAPDGKKAEPVVMEPGDVLFFNGSVIHGSPPNRSKDQWRRSLILHYLPSSSTHVSKYYQPLLDFEGRAVEREFVSDGGPCGAETPAYGTYGKWH